MNKWHPWTLPPPTEDQLLLWLQVTFLWMFVNYVLSNDPVGCQNTEKQTDDERQKQLNLIYGKAVGAFVCCLLMPGLTWTHVWLRILLASLFAAFAVSLPQVRRNFVCNFIEGRRAYTAELEIMTNLLFVISSWTLISLGLHISPQGIVVELPVSDRHLAFVFALCSAVAFSIKGATHIIRGVLDESGVVPKLPEEDVRELESTDDEKPAIIVPAPSPLKPKEIDTKEYKRGELIGNLERLLLLIFVLLGAYGALGFVVAAKGFIRSRHFNSRDFAEYFIVGTLASTFLAAAIGLLLRFALFMLW